MIVRRVLPAVAMAALVAACASSADGPTDADVDPVGDTVPAITAAVPSVSIVDVPDAASEFGLPGRVVVDIDLDDSPSAVFDVSPATLDPSTVGLDSAVASCWAVEGPDWLPVEVLVVADDSSSIRIVESTVATRSRTAPGQGDPSADGVEVTVTLDRGDGRPVLADGRLFAEDDLRTGRVEAITHEGARLVADYRCEGEVADPSDAATVEVSLRLVRERLGTEVVRTFGLRADGSTVCRSGSDTESDLLEVNDARWAAGGLTGITVGADGTVTATILGTPLTVRAARLDGAPGMGILSAVTDDGARLDGAWSCRGVPSGTD